MNAASNANCYCGDNSPLSGSPYDMCTGACNPASECSPATQMAGPPLALVSILAALAMRAAR